ncbi:hypothetical protein ACJX0J_038989, partial [Zea mays]
CCLALWCGPCVSYMLRKRALYNDMSRYVCCAGYMPCSGKCGESRCPEFCLATEVFLCFGNSVASTRFLLQDEFNIQTTQCDNCIIGFMLCLQQVACIFSIVAAIVGSEELSEASQILNCLSDLVYWTVCACMQTQHKVEMDKRDGKVETAYMVTLNRSILFISCDLICLDISIRFGNSSIVDIKKTLGGAVVSLKKLLLKTI